MPLKGMVCIGTFKTKAEAEATADRAESLLKVAVDSAVYVWHGLVKTVPPKDWPVPE